MTNPPPAVVCRDVRKRFGPLEALDSVSLMVERGEIFGLVGPDGAGKSTIIRCIMGIESPDGGEILLAGTPDRVAGREKAGYVPQRFSLYVDLTVMENIALAGALYGANARSVKARARDVLERTELWEFRDRAAGALSGGMKQKLALACGLVHTPEVLFLDEPTTGVDPVSRREFWAMLYALNRSDGMTIFVSTPYMDEAELCTRIAFLHRGKVLDVGEPKELLSRYPYRILEVRAESGNVRRFFRGVDGPFAHGAATMIDASPFGSSYHLVVRDADIALAELSKVEGLHAQEVPPSLEDLFVYYSGDLGAVP